jgi:hypothetical protein
MFHARLEALVSSVCVLCMDGMEAGAARGPRVSRAGRYTGGYPVPGCGKHLSHQCRGDREEASPLMGGREIPSLPLRPSVGRPSSKNLGPGTTAVEISHGRAKAGGTHLLRRVLQRGHIVCILDNRVDKPTDNGPVCLLCYGMADADLWKRPPAVGPGAFPNPPTRQGPAAISTEVPGPVLRAGPDADAKPKPPRGITKGTRARAGRHHRVEPHAEVITHG